MLPTTAWIESANSNVGYTWKTQHELNSISAVNKVLYVSIVTSTTIWSMTYWSRDISTNEFSSSLSEDCGSDLARFHRTASAIWLYQWRPLAVSSVCMEYDASHIIPWRMAVSCTDCVAALLETSGAQSESLDDQWTNRWSMISPRHKLHTAEEQAKVVLCLPRYPSVCDSTDWPIRTSGSLNTWLQKKTAVLQVIPAVEHTASET